MNARAFVQRHPIAVYLVLAYSISWGGSFAAVGSSMGQYGQTIPLGG